MTVRIIGSTVAWTRDCRPRWILNELELPYEKLSVELFAGGGQAPEHLARHPLGKVPVLEDGEVVLWESGATVAYLVERYGADKLIPPPGTPARGRYHQWFFFAVTSVEPLATKIFGNVRFRADQPDAQQRIADAWQDLNKLRRALEPPLESQPYLVGDAFTAADVMLGSCLHWLDMAEQLDKTPVLKRYHDRLAERPAFKKTFAEGTS